MRLKRIGAFFTLLLALAPTVCPADDAVPPDPPAEAESPLGQLSGVFPGPDYTPPTDDEMREYYREQYQLVLAALGRNETCAVEVLGTATPRDILRSNAYELTESELKRLRSEVARMLAHWDAKLATADRKGAEHAFEQIANLVVGEGHDAPQWLAMLEDKDAGKRRIAVTRLGIIAEENDSYLNPGCDMSAVVGGLTKALADEDAVTQYLSLLAHAELSWCELVNGAKLAEFVQHEDSAFRSAALKALTENGAQGPRVIDALLKAARDPDAEFADAAIHALACCAGGPPLDYRPIQDQRVIRALAAALATSQERLTLLEALAHSRGDAAPAVPEICRLLRKQLELANTPGGFDQKLCEELLNTLAPLVDDGCSFAEEEGPSLDEPLYYPSTSLRSASPDQRKEALDTLAAALDTSLNYTACRNLARIGPSALPLLPAVRKQLSNGSADVRAAALCAIGRMGPSAAKDAGADVRRCLHDSEPPVQAAACNALRELQCADSAVGRLRELFDRGDKAVRNTAAEWPAPAGAEGIELFGGTEETLRDAAARALASAGEPGVNFLKATAADPHDYVAAAALAALQREPPRDAAFVRTLGKLLTRDDDDLRWLAAHTLSELGPDAAPAKRDLLRLVAREAVASPDWKFIQDPLESACAVLETLGLSDEEAAELAGVRAAPTKSACLLSLLTPHPGPLAEFLKCNPTKDLIAFFELCEVLAQGGNAYEAAKREILSRKSLPPELLAISLDPRFLPELQKRRADADAYKMIQLQACIAALDPNIKPKLRISESQPHTFRPASAKPGGDRRRMPPKYMGMHGDGSTLVVISGRLVMPDGSPVKNPRLCSFFFDFDEVAERKKSWPLRYHAATGRFVFVTALGATYAYSVFGHRAEMPGPYSTGGENFRLEADGCRPLEFEVFDEMPPVEITLSPQQSN
jgi:hypothetical protein